MRRISFFVPGIPVPKARPKARRMGNHIHIYTPSKTGKWEDHVKSHALEHYLKSEWKCIEDAPVRMDIAFNFPRPTSQTKRERKNNYHFRKPDRDNLEKSICDALEGLFFKNDSQVCAGEVAKFYCGHGCTYAEPGVFIKITEIVFNTKQGGVTW